MNGTAARRAAQPRLEQVLREISLVARAALLPVLRDEGLSREFAQRLA
jgi:hypothetical protein